MHLYEKQYIRFPETCPVDLQAVCLLSTIQAFAASLPVTYAVSSRADQLDTASAMIQAVIQKANWKECQHLTQFHITFLLLLAAGTGIHPFCSMCRLVVTAAASDG